MPTARIFPGSHLETLCLDRPFSNFTFVDQFAGGCTALRRIFSQVRRNGCRTLIIEDIAGADDILQEDADLKSHSDVGTLKNSQTFRLSFFTIPFSEALCPDDLNNTSFVGYAILRITQAESGWGRIWIYESVIRPERITNNFIRRTPKWQCCILGKPLEIHGYLYAQQNGKTNCCAHVAVRSAAASFTDKSDFFYHEMNSLIGGYDGPGLNTQQMVQILEEAGASCFVGSFNATISGDPSFQIPFQKYIYGSIESGYPAIIFFGVGGHGEYHAIPAIGHTFNQDNWVPRAEFGYFTIGENIRYIPSESWLSMFICHDDNFGSNYCIPRHYLHTGNETACEECKQQIDEDAHQACVCYVIGTMPNFIKINPIAAEAIGADYLFELKEQIPPVENEWFGRLKHSAAHNKLVLRPILVTTKEYIDHLSSVRSWTGQPINESMLSAFAENLADDWFWLIELSVSELFAANKRKVGEVLIRATVEHNTERLFDSFVLARLPGYFVLYGEDLNNEDSANFAFIPSGVEDHVELFGQEENGS